MIVVVIVVVIVGEYDVVFVGCGGSDGGCGWCRYGGCGICWYFMVGCGVRGCGRGDGDGGGVSIASSQVLLYSCS